MLRLDGLEQLDRPTAGLDNFYCQTLGRLLVRGRPLDRRYGHPSRGKGACKMDHHVRFDERVRLGALIDDRSAGRERTDAVAGGHVAGDSVVVFAWSD
jgi:hypothetical protein